VSSVDPQSFDDLPLSQMRINDFVDIVLIDKGVPDRFRVNDTDRAGITAIEASGLVDSDLAGTREAERFNPRFGVLPHRLAAPIGAARATIVALIEAKKYVALKMAHWAFPSSKTDSRNHKRLRKPQTKTRAGQRLAIPCWNPATLRHGPVDHAIAAEF
jgi:hypothetical protein